MDAMGLNQAAMQGVARYLKWKEKFLKSWMEGVQKQQLKMLWSQMPPAIKEKLKTEDPEKYRMITDLFSQ